MTKLYELGAKSAADKIIKGELTSRQLVEACIQRIDEIDANIQAWSYFDPDYALSQAEEADKLLLEGNGVGPLHGVPVGIKDIIDTCDMPTENGTPLHSGRQPEQDAAVVSRLREAGAVILGKTVTTELAVFTPAKTRNPHNHQHTPGGSSSGTAAAVASNMIPVALGTQTGGSIIRPAAFCGVFALKPTFGLIPRTNVLNQSPILDTIGPFARSVEDLALLLDCLAFYDGNDSHSILRSKPSYSDITMTVPQSKPRIAIVRTPFWNNVDFRTTEIFSELQELLGDRSDEIDLGVELSEALAMHRRIHMADIATNYGPLFDEGPDLISEGLIKAIREGQSITAKDYNIAMNYRENLNSMLSEILQNYDAILTPSSTGAAPRGLGSTGNPIFNSVWTYAGVPAVNLPHFLSDNLPVGVQLVGRRCEDGKLLRTANWLTELLRENDRN